MTRAMAKPEPPLWRDLAIAFWQGATTPSRSGLAALLASFAAMLAFSLWFFSPSAMAGRMGDYLPRSPLDAEGFATVNATRLGAHWIERPTILALGSSTIAQALDDGEHMRQTIRNTTGQEWDFISLTTPQQSPLDRLALLETVLSGHSTGGPPLLILLSTSGQRFTWTPERILEANFQNRIGLQSNWAAEEITRLGGTPPRQTGIYAYDNFGFVCLNGTEALIRLALGRPAERRIAAYANGPVKTGEARALATLQSRFLEGQDNATAYLAMQSRLIDRLSSYDNVHVLLMDEPYAPDTLQTLGLTAQHASSAALIAQFADDHGLAWLTPTATAGLGAGDYHDALHIKSGAPQTRVQEALGYQLVTYINEAGL